MQQAYFVYILAARKDGPIYAGATNDLHNRVEQHRSGAVAAHTRKYAIHTLVWFEVHETLEAALTRERTIKRWRRAWKINLIEERNPEWLDISTEIPL